MAMDALIIQADKKARDGMWLVLSISKDSKTIRVLPAKHIIAKDIYIYTTEDHNGMTVPKKVQRL